MKSLYQTLAAPDRNKTQARYQANYYPINELSLDAKRLVCWRRPILLFKGQILNMLDQDMLLLNYAPLKQAMQQWEIHWVNNNIPTQIEWERKALNHVMRVEFRVIVDGTKFALLSF